MAYADQEMGGNRIFALILAIGIVGSVGAGLIISLNYEKIKNEIERVTTVDIKEEEPPEEEEPPPPPEEIPEFVPPPFVPPPQVNLNPDRNQQQSSETMNDTEENVRDPKTKRCTDGTFILPTEQCRQASKQCPDGLGGSRTVAANAQCPEQMKRCEHGGPVRKSQQCAKKPGPPPTKAKPRNNTSRWVTANDYRTSWINRDYTGTVSFNVTVGANGKVQSCSVTGGTAPQPLKDASCKLIKRRAKFTPATKDGQKVSGSYSSKIRWQIPE